MRIGIFITAYNVSGQIIDKVLQKIPDDVYNSVDEIAIIDNCSSDHTVNKVLGFRGKSKYREKISVLQNKENYGYGGTHKVAFSYFIQKGFDYIIMLHGDGQADTLLLRRFIDLIREDKYDLIIGSRFVRGNRLHKDYSKLRVFGNRFFVGLQKLVSGISISDPGTGYLAYNLKLISSLPYLRMTSGFTFEPELFLYLSKRRVKIKEIPMGWGEVEKTSANVFLYSLDLLKVLLRFRIRGIRFEDKSVDDYRFELV